ncbi:cyclase family protein [Zhouia amylolytica]|uniref:Putative metal-dependent hydrolase n=1 Tax=Zhouia amylolytica AD3 TaxID=1286632 RepID=W2US90_9FLAO|nr:cyclase family protein [Zhouia amylolytica]ETN97040.1 putative metal-dependent hydrolase [Zhouia amylolytica AD3]
MTCCKSETTQKNNSEGTVFLNELQNQKIIDLTYSFSNKSIYWVTAKEFELQVVAQGQTDKGFYYAANNFSTAEHGGTHIDAPRHFYETGQTVDQIPLFNLIGNAIKVNVVHNTKNNPDYQVSIDDFKNWEQQHNQPIPNGSIVIIETGFGAFYPDKQKYLGTVNRGPEAVKELHFPGLSPEAASWLITERNIKAVGLDTPSIDYGKSQDFKSHVILMSKNIPVFENVANVEQLPDRGFQIIALPIKIEGGSGGPLRIIAILDEQAPYY